MSHTSQSVLKGRRLGVGLAIPCQFRAPILLPPIPTRAKARTGENTQ